MLGRTSWPRRALPATRPSPSPAPTSTSPTPPPCEPPCAARAPDAVINCAAWTDVDGAETAEAQATAVNGDGAGHLRRGRRRRRRAARARLDATTSFDGTRDRAVPRGRADRPAGRLRALQARGRARRRRGRPPRYAIVRSSWLFGPHGKNFVDTMLRLGAERDELAVVDDQVGCPTYTGHLAPALVEIAERGLTGVLHVAGGGHCSWFDLAVATFEETGLDCRVQAADARPTLGRPAPAPRVLACSARRAPTRPCLPPWHDGLRAHLRPRGGARA